MESDVTLSSLMPSRQLPLTLFKQPSAAIKGTFSSVELCAGGGGSAIGIEQAGFSHRVLVELDRHAVQTLRANRPHWRVDQADLASWSGKEFRGTDLFAAGLPCPPFSKAGKQLGEGDERNLFPEALRIISEIQPRAVVIENVRGILDGVFDDFRYRFQRQIESMGYHADWRLLNASDYGVPQLRPRVVFVALLPEIWKSFSWPSPQDQAPTVGEVLYKSLAKNGWKGASSWRKQADIVAPTLVGGSKKHGGPDLGPTRARKAWAALGINGTSLADDAPPNDYVGMPRLTLEMCALIQGFPADWKFCGGKTAAYRQVGNAFPPPVARAVTMQINAALAAKNAVAQAA
jgi:DNA (cytosine-5)-methyltransferase 1